MIKLRIIGEIFLRILIGLSIQQLIANKFSL